MDFAFSDEQLQVQEQVHRLLAQSMRPGDLRHVLEGDGSSARALWRELGELGFLGITVPEEYGGVGAGYLELCLVAEELGRVLAPVPFSSSIFWGADLINRLGSETQKRMWLPRIATGEAIACIAFSEGPGNPAPDSISMCERNGMLWGQKAPVMDGDVADVAVVLARSTQTGRAEDLSLYLVDLAAAGVNRTTLQTIDPTRGQAEIIFDSVAAEPLGTHGTGWKAFDDALDRAAILTAFEQLGGADAALEMARCYALDRHAFGRKIGSFQAIKHKLSDMYVANTLARSNCYFGAWSLSTGAADLGEAAALARVSTTEAFQRCAKENIQVHGGVGFTWEYDCHLYYRRSNLLAVSLGGLSMWQDRLIDRLRGSDGIVAAPERGALEKAA